MTDIDGSGCKTEQTKRNPAERVEFPGIALRGEHGKENIVDKLPVCYGQGVASYCPSCGSGEYLHNEDGNENDFCGQCGAPLDWSQMHNEDIDRVEEKHKCGECAEYCCSANKEAQGVCKAKGVLVRRGKPACKKHFRKAIHIWR